MRKLLFIIMATLVFTGCTNYEPTGRVVGTDHEERRTYMQPVMVGKVMTQQTRVDDEDWYLILRRCEVENPDRCKNDTVAVTESTYNAARKGDIYNVDTEKLITA